jgi:periplasmic protein TonB
MSAATYRDEPWRRMPWLLPAALLLSLLSLMGFLRLLAGPVYVPPAPQAVELQVIELPVPPAPATVSPPEPEPPPPPVIEPKPPPEPLPEVTPEPQTMPEAKLEPPPPPKPPRQRLAKPSTNAPPPLAAPTPAPAAPTQAAPPNIGNMGAHVLYQPKPEIPEELRHHPLELTAVARFHVAANGAAEVELIEPTPEPSLNRALLETLKTWRFFPALENGKAVASSIDIHIPISVR